MFLRFAFLYFGIVAKLKFSCNEDFSIDRHFLYLLNKPQVLRMLNNNLSLIITWVVTINGYKCIWFVASSKISNFNRTTRHFILNSLVEFITNTNRLCMFDNN